MKRASASRITSLSLTCALLWSAGTAAAIAQTVAPPQIDSVRLAETKGTSAAIRNYAHLMVTSHIPVVDAL
jgi:putative membrane protein